MHPRPIAASWIQASTLEMLVQLRYNRDLWDEKEVDDIMTRTQSAHVMEPPTPTPCSQLSVSTSLSISSASRQLV